MPNDVFSIKDDIKVEFYIPSAGSWIWSVSVWDGADTWADATSGTLAWTDLLCELVEIQINHGCDVNSAILVAPGQAIATIKMRSAIYDPGTYGAIHAGTPVKISYRPEPDTFPSIWVELFNGVIETTVTTYDVYGHANIVIQSRDGMRAFLNTPVNSFPVTLYEKSGSILDRLAASYWTGSTAIDVGAFEGFVNETYANTTVGEICNNVVNGALGYLWVDRDGVLSFEDHDTFDAIFDLGADYSFSNVHTTDPNHICMSDMQITADARNYPNQLRAIYGTTGSGVNTYLTDFINLYGSVYLEVDTHLASASYAGYWLQAVTLTRGNRRVENLTFQPIARDGVIRDWHLTEKLFNIVNVDYQTADLNINDNYVVTKQIDTITPVSWDTTLELWRGI